MADNAGINIVGHIFHIKYVASLDMFLVLSTLNEAVLLKHPAIPGRS